MESSSVLYIRCAHEKYDSSPGKSNLGELPRIMSLNWRLVVDNKLKLYDKVMFKPPLGGFEIHNFTKANSNFEKLGVDIEEYLWESFLPVLQEADFVVIRNVLWQWWPIYQEMQMIDIDVNPWVCSMEDICKKTIRTSNLESAFSSLFEYHKWKDDELERMEMIFTELYYRDLINLPEKK